MPDFGAPIAQNVDVSPQRGIQTLSGLLSLQGQQATVQQQQQTASQRAGIAAFMSNFDPTKHQGPDGTLDLDSVLTDPQMRQAAGDQFPQLVGQMIQIKQGQLQAKQQLVNLNDSTRTQFQQMLGGLRTDPDVIADNGAGRQKVDRAMGQFAATGPDAARIAQIYGGVTQHAPQGKLAEAISSAQLQAMDASTQAGRQAPTLTSTGASLVNVNPQAAGGNVTAPAGNIPLKVGPGVSTFSDQAGNIWAFNPQNPNQATLVGQGGGRAGGGTGPQKPPVTTLGEQATIADVQKEVEGLRNAGTQIGTNRDINRRILSLVKETSTGPGSGFIHQAAAAAGLPTGASYQELNSFLDRQAAQAANAMGLPNTNMGLETSKQFTGNTQLDNKVIADKTKFVDSLNDAAQKYLAGANRAVGTGKNPDYTAYQEFRAKWSQNFDPEVFAYEHAIKTGDTAEQTRIEAELGRRGMSELRQKRQALIGAVNGQ